VASWRVDAVDAAAARWPVQREFLALHQVEPQRHAFLFAAFEFLRGIERDHHRADRVRAGVGRVEVGRQVGIVLQRAFEEAAQRFAGIADGGLHGSSLPAGMRMLYNDSPDGSRRAASWPVATR
jgi:hypothetical protein